MRDRKTDPADAGATKSGSEAGPKADNDAKLAAALRANLMRRKAAARQAASPRQTTQDKDAER